MLGVFFLVVHDLLLLLRLLFGMNDGLAGLWDSFDGT